MPKFDFADITLEHVICVFMNLSCNGNPDVWNWTLFSMCSQLNLVSLKFWSINILLNQSKPFTNEAKYPSISLWVDLTLINPSCAALASSDDSNRVLLRFECNFSSPKYFPQCENIVQQVSKTLEFLTLIVKIPWGFLNPSLSSRGPILSLEI